MTAEPGSSTVQKIQILLIEDNQEDRDLLALQLSHSSLSFELTSVATRSTLAEALARKRWDIVISDHRLPGFSSREALGMVRELDPEPPFILVSGHIGEAAAVEALLDGAVDFVKKDNLARLAGVIQRVLLATELRNNVRATEFALRASEKRFRTLTELSPAGIYLTNAQQECVYVNEQWCAITAISATVALGRDWRSCLQINSDDAAHQSTSIFAEDPENPLSFETRITRAERGEVWVMGRMLPQFDSHQNLVGHVGVITDITERKHSELQLIESEKRLRELSSHMVQIEENQRAMIAREIHDEIGSSLTAIKIDLAWLKDALGEQLAQRPELQIKLQDLEKLTDTTAAVSRRLIKALRPSILDHGIVPAIQWQLLEFERRFRVRCHFEPPKDEPRLTEEQSVAVFRILQEALNNVAKHSGATQVEVTLFKRIRELTIEIRDNGRGLAAGKAERPGSFGVIGMRERITSLGGWLEIGGAQGEGVSVMIGIPHVAPKQLKRA